MLSSQFIVENIVILCDAQGWNQDTVRCSSGRFSFSFFIDCFFVNCILDYYRNSNSFKVITLIFLYGVLSRIVRKKQICSVNKGVGSGGMIGRHPLGERVCHTRGRKYFIPSPSCVEIRKLFVRFYASRTLKIEAIPDL